LHGNTLNPPPKQPSYKKNDATLKNGGQEMATSNFKADLYINLKIFVAIT